MTGREAAPAEGLGDAGTAAELVTTAAALERVAARCAAAPRLAADVEANGLFAYRPRLCTLQLAWQEGAQTVVVVVDTLVAPVGPLAAVLGATGPVKVLHDLTFDAKMLDEAGAPLARVRDTSVAARLLGQSSTGLSALLEAELGVRLDKRFQQHDWAARPLGPTHLAYLASDVRHLLELDERLAARADELGIEAEVAEECAYKLATAGAAPRDVRPAWVRVKGAARLDALGRAALRRLVMAREAVAEREDVPPFKVIVNEVLLELAHRRPTTAAALRSVRGAATGRAGRHTDAWLPAIAAGIQDGDAPEAERTFLAPQREDRALTQRRRAREMQLSAWRKAEAALRGVDEQAVLPGHCASALVELFLRASGDDAAVRASIAAIPGFGAPRLERYGDALVELYRAAPPRPGGDPDPRAPRSPSPE